MPPRAKSRRKKLPLFQRYQIKWLARVTGYSIEYLYEIRRGARPAGPRFRRLVTMTVAQQGQDEITLFGRPRRPAVNGRKKIGS